MSTSENWHDYFVADFEAGTLTWKARTDIPQERIQRMWNTRYAGKRAGCLGPDGYWAVRLFRKSHYIHRILYVMANGPIPEGMQVDHIDHNRGNNCRSNFRLATNAENNWNTGLRSSNASGMKGVSWVKDRAKWRAGITHHGRSIHIGNYPTKEEAAAAYAAAAVKYYGAFASTH